MEDLINENRIQKLNTLGKKSFSVTAIPVLVVSTTSKNFSIRKEANNIFEQREEKWLNKTTRNKFIREVLSPFKTWINIDDIVCKDLELADCGRRVAQCKG